MDRKQWARAGFALAVAAGCVWTLSPFLVPMAWGAAIAVACEPLASWAAMRLGGRGRAALAVAAGLSLVVALPLGFAAAQAAAQIGWAVEWGRSIAAAPWPAAPGWLSGIPALGDWLSGAWDGLAKDGVQQLAAVGREHAGEAASYAASLAAGVGSIAARAAMALMFAAMCMAGGPQIAKAAHAAVEGVFGQGAQEWLAMAASAVRGVALGVCGTALCLSVAVGAGLALAGVPAVSLLSCVAMALCVAQIGPMPILLPAAGWLAMEGRWGAAGGLAALAVALSVVDGVLRPWLIGREIKMPMLMIFAGVVGGLVSMGMLGLFAGPMALAMGRKLWLEAEERGRQDLSSTAKGSSKAVHESQSDSAGSASP